MNQQTDNLIEQLSLTPKLQNRSELWLLGAQGGVIILCAVVIFLIALLVPFYQFREHYVAIVMHNPVLVFKQLLPLIIAIGSASVIFLGRYPESSLQKRVAQVLSVSTLVFLGVLIYSLSTMQRSEWIAALRLDAIPLCLFVISAASIFASLSWMVTLRKFAVTKFRVVGFWIGVNAGAVTAIIYALVCTEDSPLFFMPWYTMAILLSGVFAMLMGQKLLKW